MSNVTDTPKSIPEAIQAMMRGLIPVQVQVCKVDSIDKNNATIDATPVNGDAQYLEVRLRSIIDDDKGNIIYPAKDSLVLVGIIQNDGQQPFVCAYSEIESISTKIKNNSFSADKDELKLDWKKITINGGNNKGLVKLSPLVNDINAIKKDINNLKTIITGWTPVAQDGGTALKGPAQAWASQTLSTTNESDLENDKIKH